MIISNFSNQKSAPNITTRKSSPTTTNFANGIFTYKPNDTMDYDEIRLAQDARFDRVGEYGTRKGLTKLTEPIGKTILYQGYSDTYTMSALPVASATYTATADTLIYSANITVASSDTANYGVLQVQLAIGGELVATSCIDPSLVTSEPQSLEVIFINCPDLAEGQSVEVSVSLQNGGTRAYEVATVNGALMVNLNTATAGGITNVFEANINGYRAVLFAQNNTLYIVDDNGNSLGTRSLPSGAGQVRFSQNINQIRYTDGAESPQLITPNATQGDAWSFSSIAVEDLQTGTPLNITMSNIMDGVADNIMYFVTDPDTEAVWTYPYGYTFAKQPAYTTTATISGNPGDTLSVQLSTITPSGIAVGDRLTGQGNAVAEVTSISGTTVNLVIVDMTPTAISSYDKFSQDFYQNFPAIQTGDPITAMFNLGGVLYVLTRKNKYQMFAQTADNWSQAPSQAQNGTFSQESVVCDLNYAYFANDSGIYVFDGSSESSLTEDTVQNVYDAIPDKEKIRVDLYRNRLYVFYASQKGGVQDTCLVYNINLRLWESFDAATYVSATCARKNPSSRFLVGHSKVGMLMLAESDDNNYDNLGSPLAFNLNTSYHHFGSTSQLKRIPKWRPEFAATTQPYAIQCGYALDFTDQVNYAFSIDLQAQEIVNENYVWDNPSNYGVQTVPTTHTTLPQVNGEFYRCQIRYQHIAAFEPVIFRSHTLTVQTQRIR